MAGALTYILSGSIIGLLAGLLTWVIKLHGKTSAFEEKIKNAESQITGVINGLSGRPGGEIQEVKQSHGEFSGGLRFNAQREIDGLSERITAISTRLGAERGTRRLPRDHGDDAGRMNDQGVSGSA